MWHHTDHTLYRLCKTHPQIIFMFLWSFWGVSEKRSVSARVVPSSEQMSKSAAFRSLWLWRMGYIIVELSQSDSTLQVSAARIIYGCGRIGTEFFTASGAQKCFNNWLRRELEQGSVPRRFRGCHCMVWEILPNPTLAQKGMSLISVG